MEEDREKFLKCPFCGGLPGPLEEIETPFRDIIDGGHCSCGAIYVFDRSGRKLGEAYSEALVLAYDWDYDRAFSAPEGDYEEAVIRYNNRIKMYLTGEGSHIDRFPKFYFIKRKKV